MIHKFTCKNFYSFGEETTISFVVNNNAPEDNGYFTAPSGNRLSKVETVIGPNASGKTNMLKILPFLKWLIIDSFNAKPEDPIVVQPFAFAFGKANEPTNLSVVFEIDGKVYTYEFVLTKEKILNEKLELTSFAKEKKSTKKIFSRTWNKATNRYDLNGENFKLPKGFDESLLRTNASVIGTAARFNHVESQAIAKYWGQIETNVMGIGHTLLIHQLFETLSFYSDNEVLKKEAEKLLSRFDLGLRGIEFKKDESGSHVMINDTQAIHSIGGKEHLFPIFFESLGTQQLFIVLKTILQALDKGSIAVMDEFDAHLHPEMVMALYDLFIQPETNPKNAQLFMSTNSHILLSKLDKYQIVLVEKNDHGISEVWRLDEMSNVRSDENYYSKYIAGAYGALPKI